MPKPVYLPPGVDPTQIERPLAPAGCMKYVWLVALFVGLCGGISLGATIFSVHATPAPTRTTTETPTATPTITPTLKPGVTPTATLLPTQTPFVIHQTSIITATPMAITPTYIPSATPTDVVCWYWHPVKKGETLVSLAIHFGVPMATIQAWNGITNPNRIFYGSLIRIKTECVAATTRPATALPTKEAAANHVFDYF